MAVSFPMPVLAPVTTATFPGSWTVDVHTPLENIFLQTEEESSSVLHFPCFNQRALQPPVSSGPKDGVCFGSFYRCPFIGLRKAGRKKTSFLFSLKNKSEALAGVAQWIECWPVNQRGTGSIPHQGTCLGCGPGSQWGVCERQPHTAVPLPLFLPLFFSL